jgi:hypothetical protein
MIDEDYLASCITVSFSSTPLQGVKLTAAPDGVHESMRLKTEECNRKFWEELIRVLFLHESYI